MTAHSLGRAAALISVAAVAGGVAACHPKPIGAIGRTRRSMCRPSSPRGGP